MKKQKEKKYYVCGIDWQYLDESPDNRVFKSLKALKKDHECWKECGVVEISGKWLTPQKID